ncbi:MAG: hypothetical protein KGQ59_11220, partial [Bdellovibrionales bacterium]|nr:hypothetical protein [Bdellovibrionales bacterium]
MKKRSVTRWNVLLIPTLFIFLVVAEPTKQTHAAKKDSVSSCEQKALQIVKKMTLDEKIVLTSGVEIYKTTGVPRLGVPALDMTDGPSGVVLKKKVDTTAFPAGVTMAATFNPDLVGQAAAAMAREAKIEGHNILLGPCVNIHRTPLGGRNFESLSGEDPFLGQKMAPAFVKGVQSEGVLTSTKHFALNEQEFDRLNLNVDADDRTLHEIYFPPFQAAIDAGSTSVMAAYNRVRGSHASTSRFLLTEILREKWGFKGFSISDWGANHHTSASIQAGLDIEMPYVMPSQYIDVPPKFTPPLVKEAIAKGEVRESDLDRMVSHQLWAMCSVGALTPTASSFTESKINGVLQQSVVLARRVAEEGTVLLKNEGQVLPIDAKKIQTIALIGPNSSLFPPGG